jgi:hypothetical protein
MKKCRTFLVPLAFTLLIAGGAIAAPATKSFVTTSQQQGMHQWPALNGKLHMVAGANMDSVLYERTMAFYFVQKDGAEWVHVPIVEGKNAFASMLRSAAIGETTTDDAVVTTHGKDVYLVRAALNKRMGSIGTITYKFGEAGDEYPDGPWFLFKEIGRNSYPPGRISVEEVLQKEARRKPAQ